MALAKPNLTQDDSLRQLLDRLGERLEQLGLTAALFGAAGEPLAEPLWRSEFCHRLCRGDGSVLSAMGQLANRACADNQVRSALAPGGCALLAAPVNQRRRQIGAVVACLPLHQTCQSEEFHRTCSRRQLDAAAMANLAAPQLRFGSRELPLLGRLLGWMIQDEQANRSSRQELATLSDNLADTYEELSLLYRISGVMNVAQSTEAFFAKLCQEMLEVMQLEAAAAVLLPRPHENCGERVVTAGRLPLPAGQLGSLVEREVLPRLSRPPRPLVDNQFQQTNPDRQHGIRHLLAVPLVAGNEHLGGLLLAINKREGDFDSSDLKLLGSIGSQAAIFLQNHHLYQDLQDMLMGLLHALTASIDAKDPYTCGHSRRVALLSRKLAEMAGFEPSRVQRVYLAGLLHDVGKIGMPESLLLKAGRLTDDEYNNVKRHPQIGAGILGGVRQLEDVTATILHHHERPDGRGYPDGLAGTQIPPEATIVGLADAFDAMTSCRTYRSAMPLAYVASEIRRCAGTQFDSRMVELLLSLDLEKTLAELRTATAPDARAAAGAAAGKGISA